MEEVVEVHKGLPGINLLLKESFELFKKGFLQLLVIHLGVYAIAFVLIITLIFLFLGSLFSGVLTNTNSLESAFSEAMFNSTSIVMIIAIAIIAFIATLALTLFSQIATIIILDQPNKHSYGTIIKSSIKFLIPVFVVTIIFALIFIPSLFLFIVPAIAVAVFFAFVSYELILNNKGILGSFRRSIYVVKSNFWSIFFRLIIIFALGYLIGVVTDVISYIHWSISIVSFIITIIYGWFVVAYTVTLYKQAESAAPSKEGMGKLRYFVILAVVGFLFMILIFTAFASLFNSLSKMQPDSSNSLQYPYLSPAEEEMPSDVDSTDINSSDSSYLNDAFKTAFVDSCSQSGGDSKTCTCMADYLLSNYSEDELIEISQQTLESGEIPQELTNAATACVNQ